MQWMRTPKGWTKENDMKYTITKYLSIEYGGVSYEEADTPQDAALIVNSALEASYVKVVVELTDHME